MKNVLIIEKATGKVIANIPIEMTAERYTPSQKEYEAAAWEAAGRSCGEAETQTEVASRTSIALRVGSKQGRVIE